MACIPFEKNGSDIWRGMNLTYYGLFNALAHGISVFLLFVLLGAAGIPFTGIAVMSIVVLALCIPASSVIARLVEKKPFTFSVGGASFVGVIVTPWVVLLTDSTVGRFMDFTLPFYPTLAAVSIAYAVGEGTGRLACISYGCCYGKPLSECSPVMRRIFDHHHFIFTGKTKKISYASQLDGVEVIPIQAVTSVIYITAALLGIVFYIRESFIISFFIPLVATQLWRILSEFLRADYRGQGFISSYQIMAFLSLIYTAALVLVIPHVGSVAIDIIKGLSSLWNPAVIMTLEAIVVSTFLYTGRSDMTASSVSLYVNKEKI
jgi:hypothetical protein